MNAAILAIPFFVSSLIFPMHFEIELKFEILAKTGLNQFLNQLQFKHKKRMVDIYLDTKDADLCKRGIWIRIRDSKRIDYKFNRACLVDPTLEMQPYCEEHAFAYPLIENDLERFHALNTELDLHTGNSLEEFMQANDLIEHRKVDKERATYSNQEFTIVIDEVADLGTFLEIELIADSDRDIAAIKSKMDALLTGLALKRIKTSYDVLLLRKNDFEQYLQSRFILDEDKLLVSNENL